MVALEVYFGVVVVACVVSFAGRKWRSLAALEELLGHLLAAMMLAATAAAIVMAYV